MVQRSVMTRSQGVGRRIDFHASLPRIEIAPSLSTIFRLLEFCARDGSRHLDTGLIPVQHFCEFPPRCKSSAFRSRGSIGTIATTSTIVDHSRQASRGPIDSRPLRWPQRSHAQIRRKPLWRCLLFRRSSSTNAQYRRRRGVPYATCCSRAIQVLGRCAMLPPPIQMLSLPSAESLHDSYPEDS